jgi:hypothetical protein
MHFQELIKQAKTEGVNLVLTFDPYAEYETDQLGYCPSESFGIFRHLIPLGYVFADGTVTLENRE